MNDGAISFARGLAVVPPKLLPSPLPLEAVAAALVDWLGAALPGDAAVEVGDASNAY
eukprot:COSAG02_NODE_8156_length_2686_cov_6.780441_2_plen_57_part_00